MIGQRIKELRKAAKLTQQELAENIITRSYLSQIEKGIVQPSYDVLEKLAKKLDCSVESFFETVVNKDLLILQVKKELKAAEHYVELNQFDKVKNLVEKNIDLTQQGLNENDISIFYWVHGKYREFLKDYKGAEHHYLKSISCLEGTIHYNELVRSLDSLGSLYLKQNLNEKALQLLHKGYRIMIYEQIGGLLKISLLIHLGIAHGKLREFYSAINFLNEAKDINEKMKTHFKSGQLFMALGVCYMELKRFSEAKNAYKQALKALELNYEMERIAGTYTNLGILSGYEKKWEESIQFFLKSIQLYEELGSDATKILNAKAELAWAYFFSGDLNEATNICTEIIQHPTKTVSHANAYEILGEIQHLNGNLRNALDYYEFSIALYEEHQRTEKQGEVQKKMAEVYFQLGECLKAAEHFRRCCS